MEAWLQQERASHLVVIEPPLDLGVSKQGVEYRQVIEKLVNDILVAEFSTIAFACFCYIIVVAGPRH